MSAELWGIVGNPMNGRAEDWIVAAQFTSREAAIEYEKASRLSAIEVSNGGPEHYAGRRYHVWHFFYREDSALRWMNQVPMEEDRWYPGRFVRLNYFDREIPIDPELPVSAPVPETDHP